MLKRFLDRKKNKDVVFKPNKITVFYDKYLENITGIPFDEIMVLLNFIFLDFFHILFLFFILRFPLRKNKVFPLRIIY